MFKFNRGGTAYTIDKNDGDNLLICFYFDDGGNKKWLVAKDMDDLESPILYPNQNNLEENANEFLEGFISAVNSELDKKHTKDDTDPVTAREHVLSMVDDNLSFDGKHLSLK